MVSFWEEQPSSKRPKSKSYGYVKTAVDDSLTDVKLEFFAYIAGILEPFLKMYQTDKPMIPFLYFDLKSLVLTLMKLFIKSSVLSEAKTGNQLCDIDIEKESNQVKLKNIDLGFAAEAKLRNLKTEDKVTVSQESTFRREVKTFLVSLLQKLLKKTPLSSIVVRSASIFDPSIIIAHSVDKLGTNLKKLLHHLMNLFIKEASPDTQSHRVRPGILRVFSRKDSSILLKLEQKLSAKTYSPNILKTSELYPRCLTTSFFLQL